MSVLLNIHLSHNKRLTSNFWQVEECIEKDIHYLENDGSYMVDIEHYDASCYDGN